MNFMPITKLLATLCVKVIIYLSIIYLTYELLFDFTPFNGHRITSFGFKNEVLLVINLGFVCFFVSKRFYLSLLLTISSYFIFILISFEKIKFFNSPLLPSDFGYIDQLILIWPIFKSYIPIILLILVLFSLVIYFFIKIEKPNHFLKKSSFLVVISVIFIIFSVSIGTTKLYSSLKYKLASNEKGRSHLVSSSEKNGLLVTFIRNILHSTNDTEPQDYSFERIKNIYDNINKYPVTEMNKGENEKINLIVYLIESFTDPYDAGIKTTVDPIPFFHQLQKDHESGFVYSPEIGGRSANAEFEILTGFSMQFFSPSTIPFIDLPRRPIPSLARELNENKYFTKVIQAANLGFFNYKQMYSRLGFQKVMTLSGKKNIKKDIAGRFPSDSEIVDEIVRTSKTNENFFIYAFPNSTHGTWKYSGYENSPINLILDKPLNDSVGEKQLRTYMNALNTADIAIKKLINHFEKEGSKTAILILGDHQPGMPEFREQYMLKSYPNEFEFTSRKQLKSQFLNFDNKKPLISYKIMHKVPYVLWTNYKYKDTKQYNMGMNSLILRIFDSINIVPKSPFYSFLRKYSLNTYFESILKYVFYNSEGLSLESKQLNNEYKNIQYDILFGDEYYLQQ